MNLSLFLSAIGEAAAAESALKAGIALGFFGSTMRAPVDIAAQSRQSIALP
jgi:hypothetical protein